MRHPLLLAALCAASLLSSNARAQDVPAEPGAETLRPPTILVRPDPARPQESLRVGSVAASVVIVGGMAETTLDITFRNDMDRVLEGELVLPLPRGATISRFALEVNGKLTEAVVVEREKARVVFEAIERRGADPGLVEWTKGNAFKTRVYPIPARGKKRLVLAWDEPLSDRAAGHAAYVLPLGFGGKLDGFRCDVTAWQRKAPKALAGGLDVPFAGSAGGEGASCWQGSIEGREVAPPDLRLDVPLPTDESEVVVESAHDAKPGARVFVARIPVPEALREPLAPRRVTVLWDASGSASGRDLARERAFLSAYMAALGSASVHVVVFSNEKWDVGVVNFTVVDGKCDALIDRLMAIRPDGGTSFSCLDLRQMDPATDQYLLFSDGIATIGDGDMTLGSKPVVCVASGSTTEWRALERFARAGAVVNLLELSCAEAAKRALERPRALVEAQLDAARVELASPLPMRLDSRTVTIAGKLAGAGATRIVLRFAGMGDGMSREITVGAPEQMAATGLVERIWAGKRLDALLTAPVIDEAAVTTLAKAAGIVTPYTSLLVLETLDDYVRYHVVPPKEMQDAYFEKIEAQAQVEKKSQAARMETLRGKWQARLAWWSRKFEVPKGTKLGPEGQQLGQAQGGPRPTPFDGQRVTTVDVAGSVTGTARVGLTTTEVNQTGVTPTQSPTDSITLRLHEAGDIGATPPATPAPVLAPPPGQQGQQGGNGGVQERTRPPESPRPAEPARRPVTEPPPPPTPATGDLARAEADARLALERAQAEAEAAAQKAGEEMAARRQETAEAAGQQRERNPSIDAPIGAGHIVTPLTPPGLYREGDRDGRTDQVTYGLEVDASGEGESKAKEHGRGEKAGGIALQPWDPKTPYLAAFAACETTEALYTCYLDWKAKSGRSTAFFLDAADYFLAKKQTALGIRVLSNVAELKLESAPLLRILGYRLLQAGETKLGIAVFREVAKIRPEEPQSFRDLGLALAEAGQWDEAVANLERVVKGQWDGRFPDVEVIALGELNDVLARGAKATGKPLAHTVPDDLTQALDVDLRVLLTWDADACDMDLWVTEPTGEKAYYSHRATLAGGAFGCDFTQGYGPEEYLLKHAIPGAYKVQVNFYGHRQQVIAGDTTIQVTVIKNYGRANEERRAVTRRLHGKSEVLDISEVSFE